MTDNPKPENRIRAMNEGDRSTEYKTKRDTLVVSIRNLLDEVERRQAANEPLGKYGVIHATKGIERTIIKDPFSEPTTDEGGLRFQTAVNFMSERTMPTGAYFYHDEQTGVRDLVVVDKDSAIEITDNPFEQLAAGPEAGYASVNPSVLGTFNERLSDGSYMGAQIEASGRLLLKKFDGSGYHISEDLADGVSVNKTDKMGLVKTMWDGIRAQILD